MATPAPLRIQYVGFHNGPVTRDYTLTAHTASGVCRFTISIAHSAFGPGGLAVQNGPDLCYRKLAAELERGEALQNTGFTVNDDDLASYREATAVPPPVRRAFSVPTPSDVRHA
jgi:hypothetical protein